MSETPCAFDLEQRYFKLDADDRGHEVEVDPQFWAQIDHRPDYTHGRLVMAFTFTADWSTWEIHPAGDELVTALEGEMQFVLRLPAGDQAVALRAGQSVVVPRGTWHTAKIASHCRALFITPCAGTRNASIPD
jgi:mannose-6-phosphate isomerase-like protein (cupin superfamily)